MRLPPATGTGSPADETTIRDRSTLLALLGGGMVVISIIVLVIGLAILQGKADARRTAEVAATNLSLTLADKFSAIIDKTDLGIAAILDEVARQQKAGGWDEAAIVATIARQEARHPEPVGFRIFGPDGKLRSGVGNIVSRNSDLSRNDEFLLLRDAAADRLMVGAPAFGATSQEWIIGLARRITNPDGSFGGAVYSPLPIRTLIKAFAALNLGQDGVVTLYHSSNRVAARFPEISGPDNPVGRSVMTEQLRAIIDSPARAASYNVASPIDGLRRTIAVRKIEGYPYTILVGLAEGSYLSEWRRDSVGLLALGAFAVALVLLSMRILHRRISERRKALVALAASAEALRISEAKAQAEEARRHEAEVVDAANATLRAVLDNTPISIGVVDEDRKYVFGNKHFCDAYGISAAELVGRSPRMIFCSDEDFAALGAAAYAVIRAGGIYDCEQKLRRADGGDFIARVIGRRIDPANPSLGTVWVVEDLTNSKLAEASRIKSEFLAMMSHEMRTPLNGIIGMLSAVEGLPEAAPMADTHATVKNSANMLLAIIGDLLDFSLLERGEFHIAESEFNPFDVIGGIEAIHRDRTLAKGLAFSVRVAGDVPHRLCGDGIRLCQIITNLVGNAVKFTESGRVEMVVTASPQVDGRVALTILVEDTGIGISQGALERLFQPFTQADSSISRRFGGTGLGLAISWRLAHLMGGDLGGESEPGRGSRFRVTLPFKLVSEAVVAPPAVTITEPAARAISVLIAEDNPTSRVVAEKIVTRLGHRVASVEDGAAALAAIQGRDYDLVLMDMRMPVMDGLAATRAIRALPAPRGRVAIIGVTANAFPQDVQDCLDAGMDAQLSKPITLAGLAEAIKRILG